MAASALRPVGPSERIELLDVLRGFALLGVLYVNMHNFGSDQVTGDAHTAALFFMYTVFESKFFSLFSLLFGMGFAIQLRRAEARNVSLIRVYWRRLVMLFLIGWVARNDLWRGYPSAIRSPCDSTVPIQGLVATPVGDVGNYCFYRRLRDWVCASI